MDLKFFNMTSETVNRINVLKKEFDLFSGCPGESTKSIIERYSHLVRSMSEKGIQKNPNEWVERLANSIPQQEWGTYLLDLKRNGEYSRLSICQFIKKLEEQMENNDVNKKNQEEKSVSSDESSEESIVVIKHQLILVLQMKVPKEHSFLIKHHLTLVLRMVVLTN